MLGVQGIISFEDAQIIDDGLAKIAVGGATAAEAATLTEPVGLTRRGVAIGTVPYMSPEQVRGEDLDARTDLFSFGAVLYDGVDLVPFGDRLAAAPLSALWR